MSPTAIITFAPELFHLLPASKRGLAQHVSFAERTSIKHLVESLGIPHTEAGELTANGQPIDWTYFAQEGDTMHVDAFRPTADGEPIFILDNHLGRLAAYLRLLGFDVLYRNDYQDEELAQTAEATGRILLTRDRRLLMRKVIARGYCLKSLNSHEQLAEVLQRYRLSDRVVPFSRCPRCNTLLEGVDKSAILQRLEPLTQQYFEEFAHCPACQQIYWKGSHTERMLTWISKILPNPSREAQ